MKAMNAMLRTISSLLVLVFCASTLWSQVATGTYPYGTFDKKGFDTINVGNLNVHFTIPVLHKAGRGVPFNFDLGYDSSIWAPVTASGAVSWQPSAGWGWIASSAVLSGRLIYSTGGNCGRSQPVSCVFTSSDFVFQDPLGATHPFGGSCSWSSYNGTVSYGACQIVNPSSDGSGLSLILGTIQGPASVKMPNGAVWGAIGANPYTDTNGNIVSVSGTQYIDTTGKIALTQTGVGTPSSPKTFTYTNTNGGAEAVAVNYQTYTVQTAFGCSGVSEFGPTSESLVSSISYPDGSAYSFSYEATPGHSGSVTGRLAGVTLRQGNTIEYSYYGGNEGIECADGSTAGLTRTLNSDSGSTASAQSYSRTITGTGTSSTAVADGLGNAKSYTFVEASNQPSGTTAEYYETGRNVYQGGGGTPVVVRNTCYNGAASPCTTTAPTLPIAQIDTYERLNGIATDGRTAKYNSYGMQTEADVYDFGSSSRGGLLRKEVWTYGTSVPSRVTQDEVFDSSGSVAANTVYAYDGTAVTVSSGVPQHVAALGARGNMTSMTQYASSGTAYTSTFTYEDTGNLLTAKTPNGTTTYTYDPTFVYNTGTTLPTPSSGVALASGASFDTANTGLPLSTTDANGQVTKIPSYDALLRPTEVEYPDGGEITFSYSPTVTTANVPAISGTTETQYDGYGRVSRTETANGQSGYYQQDVCYDGNGNAAFKSYRYAGSGFGASKVCSGAGDTYSYDVLGRVTGVTRANGETRSITYLGRAKKYVDENNVTRISQVDGLGRLTTVCEISSNTLQGASPTSCGTDIAGTGFVTSYSHALASHATTITQGAQMRVFQYDWLKRPILIQEPESGTTTYGYAYNSTGLVTTRTKPQANQTGSATTTTTTQYDSLGRVVSITYSDGTPTKSFTYDALSGVANVKGRLAYTGAGGTTGTSYSYDPMGRIAYLGECLPPNCGVAYGQNYTYDLAGDEISSTDGAGVISTYTYSPAGEILSLTSNRIDAANPAAILSGVQNGPFGPLSYNLGNGLSQNYIYDALGRLGGGWLCNGGDIAPSCSGGTQFYGFGEGWKGKQMTSLCDTVQNECSTYGYDEFNRLTSLTVSPQTPQNYTYVYDRYGNRWQQNPLNGGWSSQLGFNLATNQINTAGYAYDAAGNMTNDGFHTYTYDAEGHITAVDRGQTATYVYNALNQRVQTTVGGTVTNYVYNAAGQRVSEWNGATNAQIEGKYYWGAKPVAYYANGSTHFEHQDWLGTERMRTTYNGGVEGSYISLPWGDGQGISGVDGDANHYATLDHDTATDTDYAQFRQYANMQGRWLSPDPYMRSYKKRNPQSFNRYVYASNNPLARVDHLGLDDCDCDDGGGSDGGGSDGGGGGSDGSGGGSGDNGGGLDVTPIDPGTIPEEPTQTFDSPQAPTDNNTDSNFTVVTDSHGNPVVMVTNSLAQQAVQIYETQQLMNDQLLLDEINATPIPVTPADQAKCIGMTTAAGASGGLMGALYGFLVGDVFCPW